MVRCLDYCDLEAPNEKLLVSAGGMANIKLRRVHLENEEPTGKIKRVAKISHLYDFKRIKAKKGTTINKVKHWLYVDLEKNPDIRFMNVVVFKADGRGDSYTMLCLFGRCGPGV